MVTVAGGENIRGFCLFNQSSSDLRSGAWRWGRRDIGIHGQAGRNAIRVAAKAPALPTPLGIGREVLIVFQPDAAARGGFVGRSDASARAVRAAAGQDQQGTGDE